MTRSSTKIIKPEQPKRKQPIRESQALGSKSPLIDDKVDIQEFLALSLQPDVWNTYTNEERETIIMSLPPRFQRAYIKACSSSKVTTIKAKSLSTGSATNGISENEDFALSDHSSTNKPEDGATQIEESEPATQDREELKDPPLSPSEIMSNYHLKDQIGRFKRDLAQGYYEKTFQSEAMKAQQLRREGAFDEFLRQEAEEMFLSPVEEAVDDGESESSDPEFSNGSKDGKKRKKGRPKKMA